MRTVSWEGRCRGKGGKPFSLVELLVVIAIIAVLMCLLMPALQRARKMGLQVACANNLKQVGALMVMYSDDSDGWYGAQWMWLSATNFATYPRYYSSAYLNQTPAQDSRNIFYCPSAPAHNLTTWGTDYGFSREIYWTPGDPSSYGRRFKLSKLRPDMFSLADINGLSASPNFNQWTFTYYLIPGRHSGVVNMLHVDGRVSAIDPKSLTSADSRFAP